MPVVYEQDLEEYIKEKNDETRKWVLADPENRAAGYLPTDAKHWKQYGVETVEDFKKYELKCSIVNLTKSEYGFKPSWASMSELSLDELEAKLKAL